MNRWLALALVVIVFALSAWMSGGSLGAWMTCDDAGCVVSAASSLGSTLLSVALILLILFYPQKKTVANTALVVGVWRRFGACVLDFAIVLLTFLPPLVLPLLFVEASYAGNFHWSFQRGFTRPTDSAYMNGATFAFLLLMFCYFYLHLRVGRATIGQYVLGYRIEGVDSLEYGGGVNHKPLYVLRVITSFIGLGFWPISVVFALMAPKKAFWWDAASNTKAVRVKN